MQLSPWMNHLLRTLDRLRALDTANVFAFPVSINDAPEYDKIIKNPMDFSTVEKKIRNYEYKWVKIILNELILFPAPTVIGIVGIGADIALVVFSAGTALSIVKQQKHCVKLKLTFVGIVKTEENRPRAWRHPGNQ